MGRLTRAVTLASALFAVGSLSWLASERVPLFAMTVTAGGLCLVASRFSPRAALTLALLPVYVIPVTFMGFAGHNHHAYVAVWLAALIGAIAGSSFGTDWHLPARWRWPLVLWALLVAVSWPIVAWREIDGSLTLLSYDRLPVAGFKISAPAAVGWAAYAAAAQLVGLLWIDWLHAPQLAGHAGRRGHFPFLPLAAGVLVACTLAIYQGFVDINFLNGHVWPSMNRAAGSLMDANVFGMIAALWGSVFLVLGLTARSRALRWFAFAALPLTWMGVWMSGSRTALLTVLIGILPALGELAYALPAWQARRRMLIAVGAAALAIAGVLFVVPSLTETALSRARYLVPGLSLESVGRSARVLWHREGYGTASVAMIREFPVTGVGIGSYYTLAHDYLMEVAGINISPDNAQNWYRQQLAELGVLGSVGWIVWGAVFATQLARRPVRGADPATILRWPIVGFALASLVGMPGQDPAVVITFWLLVYWFGAAMGASNAPAQIGRTGWGLMLAIVVGYAALHARPGDLRPAFRAARFDFTYTYGFYFDRPDMIWSAKHGVTVPRATDNWMRLTVWAAHPDADERPLDTQVWVDGDRVVDRKLPRNRPIVMYAPTRGAGKRFVIEVKVDRTFRPREVDPASTDPRELGLAMKWEFVPARPQ